MKPLRIFVYCVSHFSQSLSVPLSPSPAAHRSQYYRVQTVLNPHNAPAHWFLLPFFTVSLFPFYPFFLDSHIRKTTSPAVFSLASSPLTNISNLGVGGRKLSDLVPGELCVTGHDEGPIRVNQRCKAPVIPVVPFQPVTLRRQEWDRDTTSARDPTERRVRELIDMSMGFCIV